MITMSKDMIYEKVYLQNKEKGLGTLNFIKNKGLGS